MGKKIGFGEDFLLRGDVELLRNRVKELEDRMPGYAPLPEVTHDGEYLRIHFRRRKMEYAFPPERVFRIPAEEVKEHREWRPVKKKEIHE